jgi:hypothetical protein
MVHGVVVQMTKKTFFPASAGWILSGGSTKGNFT